MLPCHILVVFVVPLHVEHVEVLPAVPVEIHRTGIARPARIQQPHFARDVGENPLSQILEQCALLGALGLQMPGEGILETSVVLIGRPCLQTRRINRRRPRFIFGIDPHIGHKQIQQPIVIVVEELTGRRVRLPARARMLRYIFEAASPVVDQKLVAQPHRRGVQIDIAVVVNVAKRRAHSDLIGQLQTRRGVILKARSAEIAP